MADNWEEIEVVRTKTVKGKTNPRGSNTRQITITIPQFIFSMVFDEAKYRDLSYSRVISYLILAGIKAHAGKFNLPQDNNIKKIWDRHSGNG